MAVDRKKLVFNALGFNLAWWGCVLGVKWGVPYLGPVLMAGYLTIHLRWLAVNGREVGFLMIVLALGTVVDSIKAATGFLHYSGGYGIPWLAPLWITAMWVGFAALLNHSLRWLQGKWLLAFALGAIFGPPAYLTGVKFGVIEFMIPQWQSILILALVWGVAVTLLAFLAQQIMGERNHGATNAIHAEHA